MIIKNNKVNNDYKNWIEEIRNEIKNPKLSYKDRSELLGIKVNVFFNYNYHTKRQIQK